MRTAKLYRYQIPIHSQTLLRKQPIHYRDGLILELSCAASQRLGLGEIAPLPQFSRETLDESIQQTIDALTFWLSDDSQEAKRLQKTKMTKPRFNCPMLPMDEDLLAPSVAFGISMAQLEFADLLPNNAECQIAPLCADLQSLSIPSASHASFACVFSDLPPSDLPPSDLPLKVKVALHPPTTEANWLNKLHKSQNRPLRLDANRVWTLSQANAFVRHLTQETLAAIEWIEEPCQTMAQSMKLKQTTGIKIAWDESLQDELRTHGTNLSTLPKADAWVIKPMLIGSVARCLTLIQQAQSASISCLISSSLESTLGLSQLARLSHWQCQGIPAGLDTFKLWQQALVRPWRSKTLPLTSLKALDMIWSASC